MRNGLILGILGLTALLFYAAIQSIGNGAQAQAAAVRVQVTAEQAGVLQEAEAQIFELEGQITRLKDERQGIVAEMARVAARADSLATVEAENSTLSASISDMQLELQTSEAQNATLVSENLSLSDMVDALTVEKAALRADKAATDDLIAEKRALLEDLDTAHAELSSLREAALQNVTVAAQNKQLSEEVNTLQSELSVLQQTARDAETAVETLNGTIATYQQEKRALEAELNALQPEVTAALHQEAEALEAEVANLQTLLDEQSAARSLAEERAAALTEDVAALTAVKTEGIETETKVAELEANIAIRDLAITELRASPQSADNALLASCQDRSEAALSGRGVTFVSGTSSLDPSAFAQLESIATIAIECAQDGLMLDIEGHTDSEGGDASNLLLSNSRAKAVHDFLAQRGVPTDALRSVGFGKSDPIADSATADGRAQNERIMFDWEQS